MSKNSYDGSQLHLFTLQLFDWRFKLIMNVFVEVAELEFHETELFDSRRYESLKQQFFKNG